MHHFATRIFLLGLLAGGVCLAGGDPPAAIAVQLNVPSGAPLRLYATSRVRLRSGQPVHAKLIEPVYAFDRIVLAAGLTVEGQISELKPIPKMERARALLNGDFTPLRIGFVRFTSVLFEDGRRLDISTVASSGLRSIYLPPRPGRKQPPPKQAAPPKPGVTANAKRQIKDQIDSQIKSRSRGVIDAVRAPNKKEWLADYLIAKLPYHPQWYRSNTRFDAILETPLALGQATLAAASFESIGAEPAPGSVAHVRLLSPLSSADAELGAPVLGVLSEPVFSAAHQLVLPEGTEVRGKVRQVRPARWFHRGGQLRFTFDQIQPPQIAMLPRQIAPRTTLTQLTAAEIQTSSVTAKVKVDEEGTAKATESKKRFIAPAIALMVAGRSLDNDADRHVRGGSATGGAEANYGGRTAGGFSGFGLLGSLAAQGSRTLGSVLGVYGLGWSVYSTVVSRGQEVEFRKNTPLEIRFTPRGTPPPGKPLVAAGTP